MSLASSPLQRIHSHSTLQTMHGKKTQPQICGKQFVVKKKKTNKQI
uniref:Uncharacterized protein n=1 Tax=Anguilla anguilla TaxID=7936 RepID=A0A0E9W3T1_ANGAN